MSLTTKLARDRGTRVPFGKTADIPETDVERAILQVQANLDANEAAYTAADVLAKLVTVDGASSGLDADLLDGLNSTAFAILAGQSGGQTLKGGTGVSDALVLQSTAGIGSSDSIQFKVGNNGATEAARFTTGGQLIFGHTASVAAFGLNYATQYHVTDSGLGVMPAFYAWSNSNVGPFLDLNKSRGTSPGSRAIVQSGDNLGIWDCAGDDGTNFIQSVTLRARVDGTPGTSDMPGRLEIRTTPDGGSTSIERVRVSASGVTTLWGAEVATSGTSVTPTFADVPLQVHVGSLTDNVTGFFYWFADNFGPRHSFYKSRGSLNGWTVVQSGDILGSLVFFGADGVDAAEGGRIQVEVDGSPGSNDMPGRIIFRTTPDGSQTSTERLRINSVGFVSVTGSVGRGAPVTKTADFTVAATENHLICNKAGSSCVVTLPSASSFNGREIYFKNLQAAQTVTSNASNVVPRAGGAATTALLAAGAGAWALLVSDGTNWVAMAGS